MSRPEIAARAAELRAQRAAFVHARVVLAERPTSAKPGDEAIVHPDGTIEGFVGGDCAESTVRAQALALLDSGESRLLRITPTPESPTPSTSGSDPIDQSRVVVHNPCLSGGTLEIFLAPEVPVPCVVVAGDAPVAKALIALGAPLGYDIRRLGDGIPDDAAAVVVASHGRDEEAVLVQALRAGVPYVGLVASRKRGEAVVASLDVCGSMSSRVVTPAGLDIGARTPEEIALSILAEIVARRPQPSGRPIVGSEATAVVAVDPVCGMSVATVETSLHLDHDEARYWFCGSGCLRAFAAAPADYVTA
jgi:xanthine dehydrogenase accessory factor